MTSPDIYIEDLSDEVNCKVNSDGLVVLFLLNCCPDLNVNVYLVKSGAMKKNVSKGFTVEMGSLSNPIKYLNWLDCPPMIQNCLLPAVKKSIEPWCVSGLTGSLRYVLIDICSSSHLASQLLGFRKGCLQACAEVSIWTKFCEVEAVKMVDEFFFEFGENMSIPEVFLRFENHLKHPPILHNKLKKQQDTLKARNLSAEEYSVLRQKKLSDFPELEHKYAEGTDFSLADIVLYCSFAMVLPYLENNKNFQNSCAKVVQWFALITDLEFVSNATRLLDHARVPLVPPKELNVPEVTVDSLYNSDPNRYKARWRAYTNQKDIEIAISYVSEMTFSLQIQNLTLPSGLAMRGLIKSNEISELSCSEKRNLEIQTSQFVHSHRLDWASFPLEVSLEGQVPDSRVERKSQQLENMALFVLSIAKDGDLIVDFCAGSGHLGILLAYLLPQCKVMLVENKVTSLQRARERIEKLQLDNIEFYQCNLDYFNAKFNIGTSLHACGVATDLVIRKCLDMNAAFVCSPCCYGSMQPNHILKYPRSALYSEQLNVPLDSYLVLGHAADQTHVKDNHKTMQGMQCMKYVDFDRLSLAEEHKYSTNLAIMDPASCTPKNHILIGVC